MCEMVILTFQPPIRHNWAVESTPRAFLIWSSGYPIQTALTLNSQHKRATHFLPSRRSNKYIHFFFFRLAGGKCSPLHPEHAYRCSNFSHQRTATNHTTNSGNDLQIFDQIVFSTSFLALTNVDDMSAMVIGRQWNWISHILWRNPGNFTRTTMTWTTKWQPGKEPRSINR